MAGCGIQLIAVPTAQLQLPIISSDCHQCFWLIGHKLEVPQNQPCPPLNPTLIWYNNLLQWVTVILQLSSDSLRPHELQHIRLPWPSPYPRAGSNSCPCSDAIQPSRPLPSPSPPAFNLSQHQGLFNSLHTRLLIYYKKIQGKHFRLERTSEKELLRRKECLWGTARRGKLSAVEEHEVGLERWAEARLDRSLKEIVHIWFLSYGQDLKQSNNVT